MGCFVGVMCLMCCVSGAYAIVHQVGTTTSCDFLSVSSEHEQDIKNKCWNCYRINDDDERKQCLGTINVLVVFKRLDTLCTWITGRNREAAAKVLYESLGVAHSNPFIFDWLATVVCSPNMNWDERTHVVIQCHKMAAIRATRQETVNNIVLQSFSADEYESNVASKKKFQGEIDKNRKCTNELYGLINKVRGNMDNFWREFKNYNDEFKEGFEFGALPVFIHFVNSDDTEELGETKMGKGFIAGQKFGEISINFANFNLLESMGRDGFQDTLIHELIHTLGPVYDQCPDEKCGQTVYGATECLAHLAQHYYDITFALTIADCFMFVIVWLESQYFVWLESGKQFLPFTSWLEQEAKRQVSKEHEHGEHKH